MLIVSNFLVFNHHSLPFALLAQAQAAMPDFLRICAKAMLLGRDTILIDQTQDSHWFRIELAPGYTWQNWYDQVPKQDGLHEQIQVFRSIATRQPLFSEVDIQAGVDMYEVWQTDQTEAPFALLAACWHEAPLLSFPSSARWQVPLYRMQIRTLDVHGNLQNTDADITNICTLAALDAVSAHWQEEHDAALKSGRDLWFDRARRFPHLIFCGKTETQLCGWRQSETVFNQVKQALTVMEQFTVSWQAKEIADYGHEALRDCGLPYRVSGESESCGKNGKRRGERTFYLPTGKPEYFENHVKLANGWRIHFFPDTATRSIHIGYIGSHLS